MKIHRGRFSYGKFNKNTYLQASNGVVIITPLLFLEDLFENLVLSGYNFFIISVISLLIMIIVFVEKKRKRKPELPPANLTAADHFNQIAARARNNPDKLEITSKLCHQHIDNHALKADVAHDKFPLNKPNCHMDNTQITKFASIVNSFPWTCGAHNTYKVKGGVVCYRDTNQSACADLSIIQWVAMYEGSDGQLPRLNQLQEDMRKLDEEDRKKGKWDYRWGLPPK